MADFSDVVMQTDTLRIAVLPELGGKLASFRWLRGEVELLQAPLSPYARRDLTMGFEQSDASGWDECLPSVAACQISTPNGRVTVPDHGDFWRLAWECRQEGNTLHLSATGSSLALRFERTLLLEGDTLQVHYRVSNVGDAEVPYTWSAHPLFAVEPGDRILLPSSVEEVEVEGSAAGRLGGKGTRHPWPLTQSCSGAAVDLSVAGAPEDGVGDKIFTPAPREGWAAIERLTQGLRIEVSFDPEKTPWLGLWLCYGGWPEGGAARQQCVAIEPCTAPADSLAEALETRWARKLAPGQSAEWPMRITVRRVSLG